MAIRTHDALSEAGCFVKNIVDGTAGTSPLGRSGPNDSYYTWVEMMWRRGISDSPSLSLSGSTATGPLARRIQVLQVVSVLLSYLQTFLFAWTLDRSLQVISPVGLAAALLARVMRAEKRRVKRITSHRNGGNPVEFRPTTLVNDTLLLQSMINEAVEA